MTCDQDLQILLLGSSLKRKESGKLVHFWPNTSLNSVLTEENIARELSKYTRTHSSSFSVQNLGYLAKQIVSEYRQIFAVLVLISEGACIDKIMGEVKDIDLPLIGHTDMFKLYKKQGGSQTHPMVVPCLANLNWGWIQRESFLRYQYAVSPVIMSLEADGYTPRHVDFDPNVILPFTEEGTERQVGGFGQVRKVKIHSECHRFNNLLRYVGTYLTLFSVQENLLNRSDSDRRLLCSQATRKAGSARVREGGENVKTLQWLHARSPGNASHDLDDPRSVSLAISIRRL